jgi:hypothetical protein
MNLSVEMELGAHAARVRSQSETTIKTGLDGDGENGSGAKRGRQKLENPPRSHTKGHEEKEKTFVSLRGGFTLFPGVARDMSDSFLPLLPYGNGGELSYQINSNS